MSEDHKPTREDEAKRIRDAGGFVINNRVMGELAVSRAFGDVDFKKGLQVRFFLYDCGCCEQPAQNCFFLSTFLHHWDDTCSQLNCPFISPLLRAEHHRGGRRQPAAQHLLAQRRHRHRRRRRQRAWLGGQQRPQQLGPAPHRRRARRQGVYFLHSLSRMHFIVVRRCRCKSCRKSFIFSVFFRCTFPVLIVCFVTPFCHTQVLTITEEDQFLLLGCDGLFDVYTPEEVVHFVKENMLKHGDAQKCCQVRSCQSVFVYACGRLFFVVPNYRFITHWNDLSLLLFHRA